MSLYIVTTTINEPTEATKKFIEISKKNGYKFIIVGDKKTPHESYISLESDFVKYLHPKEQEKKYKELSDNIGWNTIQRRNIGFLEAYNLGAEILATVDDDNIPYDFWGKEIYVNKEISVDLYESKNGFFEPLSITNRNDLWHRGYPLEFLNNKNEVEYKGKIKRKVLVQADLWDGDPDIDAITRITKKPIVKFSEIKEPYCSNQISPFNSQNTFVSRQVLKYYMMIPFVGRMDDIWASYILQLHFPNSVIYNKATVYQNRNEQDLIKNLENEIIGYKNNKNFLENIEKYSSFLPEQSKKTIEIYQKYF
jgi:hypothetical protein